jgi:sugar phosphate isomerase/epimerase
MSLLRRDFLRQSALAALALAAAPRVLGQETAKPSPLAGLPLGGMSRGMAPEFAAAGFGYLELSMTSELVPDKPEADFLLSLERLKALPIPCPMMNGFLPGNGPKIVGPQADLPALLRWVQVAFPRARRAGVSLITVGSGGARRIPKDFETDRAREQFSKAMAAVAAVAKDNGLTLAVENLNSGETNLGISLAETMAMIAAAGPEVKITVDLYHMLRDKDPATELRKTADRLVHVHVAENKGRLAPGTGGEDFRPHLSILREMGYKGSFSFECGWKGSVSPAKSAVAFREQLRSA